MKKLIALTGLMLGLVVYGWAGVMPAHALQSFSMSPMQDKMILAPTESYRGAFDVRNTSDDEDLYYNATVEPYYVDENNTPIFVNVGDMNRIVDWITIENEKGMIKPGETATIDFVVNVPKDAAGGGQYAVISVSNDPGADGSSDENAVIGEKFALGHTIIAEISGDSVESGEVVGMSIPSVRLDGKITASSKLKNTGNVHSEAINRLKVFSIFPSDEPIYDSGKNGIIKGKKIIVNPKYQSITYYNTPEVFVVNKNGKFGVLDKKGDEILKTEYQECIVLGEYISVKNNEQMMLFDIHGNLVNTNTYKSIQPTENPYYFIAKDESDFYSIISKDVQIKDNYTNIRYAFDNFFIFTNQEGKSGVLEVYTGIELEPKYDFIILLENAKALEARTETTVDIYSNKIEKILSMENGIVEKVDDNYFVVYSNKDMKYINHNGEEVKNTEVFKDRKLYATQSPEGKWGFASNSGELKIEYKYDRVTELNEYGFAGVVKDGLWGVIDEEGKEIVPPTYNLDVYYEPKFVGKYLMEENEALYCSEVTAQKVEASKKK